MEHCGPVVVVAGQWAAEVVDEVDLLQWGATSRDDDAGGFVELDLQFSLVKQVLALLARRGVKVPPAQGQGAHVHLAFGASLQRLAALFME